MKAAVAGNSATQDRGTLATMTMKLLDHWGLSTEDQATLLGLAAWDWRQVGLGALEPRITMRQVIPAVVLMMLGVQTVFASFFLGIMSLRGK